MGAAATYPWEEPPVGASAAFGAALRGALPRFETARLVVRAPEIGDFGVYAEILMSPRACYMDGPMNRSDAWADFTQSLATWLLRGHGLFTIADRAGAVLGFTAIGLMDGDQEPELGWFLTEAAEGQGFAFEAVQPVRAWGIEELGLASLVSYFDPDNARSIRLAARLGGWHDPAASERLSAAQGEAVLVYRHSPAMGVGGTA